MKKTLTVAGGALVIATGGLAAIVALQPASTVVRRSVVIRATAPEVYSYVANLDHWREWSPWQAIDSTQAFTCSDVTDSPGASCEWLGHEAPSQGKVTLTAVEANARVEQTLELLQPFTASGKVVLTIDAQAESPEGTTLTWNYTQQNDFIAKFAGLYINVGARLGTDFESGLAALKPLVEVYHQVHARELAEAKRLAEEQALIEDDVAWFGADADTCVLWKTRPGLGDAPEEVMRFPGSCPGGHHVAWNTWKDRFVFWDDHQAWVGDLHTHAAYPVPIPKAPPDAIRWNGAALEATAQTEPDVVDGQWVYAGVREAVLAGSHATACLSWSYTGDPGAPGAKSGVDPTSWTPGPTKILTYTGLKAGSCLDSDDDGTAGVFAAAPAGAPGTGGTVADAGAAPQAAPPEGTRRIPGIDWAISTSSDQLITLPAWRLVEESWVKVVGLSAESTIELSPRRGYLVFCSADHAWALAEKSGRVLWENAECPIRWEAAP